MALPSFQYSGVSYAGKPAGTTAFALTTSGGKSIDYLLRAHVHVYSSVDDGNTLVELARPVDWDFNQAGTTVVLKAGIATGTAIVLQRITPKDTLYTLFGQGTLLTADQINDAELFDLYLIQELEDELGINAANQWNRQPRYADPNKGTAKETANTVTKKDQLAGDWPIDGKDKFIATTDALSERFDVIVSDTKPPSPPITEARQPGKLWIDDGTFQVSYWEPAAKAWVNLANTGPQGLAATIALGPVTSLPAGTAATVTNTGSSQAAVFSFGIPKGDQGIQGIQGLKGDPGVIGSQGLVGPQGPIGLTGPQGPAGPKGADSTVAGPTGPAGPVGPKGADSTVAGPAGPAGLKGDPTRVIMQDLAPAAPAAGDLWFNTSNAQLYSSWYSRTKR